MDAFLSFMNDMAYHLEICSVFSNTKFENHVLLQSLSFDVYYFQHFILSFSNGHLSYIGAGLVKLSISLNGTGLKNKIK